MKKYKNLSFEDLKHFLLHLLLLLNLSGVLIFKVFFFFLPLKFSSIVLAHVVPKTLLMRITQACLFRLTGYELGKVRN